MKAQTWERVTHSFLPIYNEDSKVLILGTAPSVKSRENNFYYGHPQNRFWRVLAQITAVTLPESVEEKKAFLLSKGIALYDVIESCDIQGSSDSSIRNVVPADLSEIIQTAGRIPVLGNGGTAFRLYQKHQYRQTGIPMILLPSTSPANAAWNLQRLTDAWESKLKPYLQND
ncbi:uracil DNA glycosylase superfamily protein [Anaerotignum neopropionicum]|uniref:Uracil DNA glycosylase superfamily protein n=1 Tax=Anaerotignum neopropionicum TaxID=36847 RepID=A0A136WBY6_9FIRM|nr:DNA-deoxyinosine glycosylase [Anaerotignum neopropionicum]KXL52028.1 uracil DNA glycosylase superfamily protein [Anaerotignum neopropionicum]